MTQTTATTATVIAAFKALVNGTTGHSASNIVGTDHITRGRVWDDFRALFNESVTVSINGVSVTLKASHSLSGKSTSYFAELTPEQYIAINGSDFGLSSKKSPYMQIGYGKVTIHGGDKYWDVIDNQNVSF